MNEMKMTMITINGRTRFINLPVSADGKVRIDRERLFRMFGIRRGDMVFFGR
jgi:hypothetical protein